MGEQMNTLALINSSMSDWLSMVKLEDTKTEAFRIKRGVPQASKLGPTIYTQRGLEWTPMIAKEWPNLQTTYCSGVRESKERRSKKSWPKELWSWKRTWKCGISADNRLGKCIANELQEDGIEIDSKTKIYASNKIKYLGITLNTELTHVDAVNHALSRAEKPSGYCKEKPRV